MRIAVLCSPESWYARDLNRAAQLVGHQLLLVPFSRITATVGDEPCTFLSGECDLAECDAVLVRTMPPGSLEQVVFRMDVLARLETAGKLVLNPPKALEAAIDKYLALAKLQAAGLTVPATWVGQTAEDAMAAFERLGGDVVVKPLFGGEGRGITRVSDEQLALRAFKLLEQLGAVIYLQQYVPHQGFDLRLLVIGERVLAMKRSNAADWRTNLSRGATATPLEPDAQLVDMALRAAAAIGAPLAGVDILPDRRGGRLLLEVNAVPGWKGLSRALHVDVAALMLDYVAAHTQGDQAIN
jgi:ribosomal protein S6--L-glutamate ligase